MPRCKKCGNEMYLKDDEWVCDCEAQKDFNEELEKLVEEEVAKEKGGSEPEDEEVENKEYDDHADDSTEEDVVEEAYSEKKVYL